MDDWCEDTPPKFEAPPQTEWNYFIVDRPRCQLPDSNSSRKIMVRLIAPPPTLAGKQVGSRTNYTAAYSTGRWKRENKMGFPLLHARHLQLPVVRHVAQKQTSLTICVTYHGK